MKRLATLLTAALLVVGTATFAEAQQGPPQGGGRVMGQGGPRMMEMLLKDITLSADQQARLKEITDRYDPQMTQLREQMMAARQSGQQMSPETMQKMRDLQTEQRAAIRAMLTAEQQAVFDRNVEAMPQGRGRGGPGGGRPPRA